MNEPIIKLENVTVRYGEGTPFALTALDGINLDIPAGCVCGIIGHTGSGKSTLAQLLNGLLQPTRGKVLFKGEDINRSKQSVNDIRFKVGLVFQYPEYQLFEETVEKDIAFGPHNMSLSEEEISKRVADAARFCGIDREMLAASPFEISGGQKRRARSRESSQCRRRCSCLMSRRLDLIPKAGTRYSAGWSNTAKRPERR